MATSRPPSQKTSWPVGPGSILALSSDPQRLKRVPRYLRLWRWGPHRCTASCHSAHFGLQPKCNQQSPDGQGHLSGSLGFPAGTVSLTTASSSLGQGTPRSQIPFPSPSHPSLGRPRRQWTLHPPQGHPQRHKAKAAESVYWRGGGGRRMRGGPR